MPNPFFQFKQFTVHHDRCAMKVTTDACLFGAWVAETISNRQWTIKNQQSSVSGAKLLDVGTGTALLSLMVAQKVDGRIDAIEINTETAEQAKENSAASPWRERITIIQQDVLQWQPGKQYDSIFSNPPFYQNELKSSKQGKNVAHHDEGLKLADLLHFINNHLTEEGSFFLLLPAKREKEVESLLQKQDLHLQQKVLVQQTLKHQPFRIMIQGRREKVEQVTDAVISIKNEDDQYTPVFITLLKDYYLYL